MWITQWRAISARIAGLREASAFFVRGANGKDLFHVCSKNLIPQAVQIRADIERFGSAYATSLPVGAKEAIDAFIAMTHSQGLFVVPGPAGTDGLTAVVTTLAGLQASLDYYLHDAHARARSLTERAFNHLQRSIAVDRVVREKWKQAFADNEVACERLGAVHLLGHGIWAFKAHAETQRTDLVYGDVLEMGEVERSNPNALVLTEWKRATSPSDVHDKARQAKVQLKQYAAGVLSDLELRDVRYIVVVTSDFANWPDDVREDGILFRHIGIAVDPSSASRVAARR